jgi:hypothetical protein
MRSMSARGSMSARIDTRGDDAVLAKAKDVAVRDGEIRVRTHGMLPGAGARVRENGNYRLKHGRGEV